MSVLRRVVAASLAATLAMCGVPACALADEGAPADAAVQTSGSADAQAASAASSGASILKDETVYVKADTSGAVNGVYVVNSFDAGEATSVSDPAHYTAVKNLTTGEALTQAAGTVQLTTLADAPFSYEGEMSISTELPWDISLAYYLDGKEVSPDALSGASGDVRIELSVAAKTDAQAGVSDFANAYVLQAQGTFPEDNLQFTGADGATIAHSGSNVVASCMVLPGESKTFSIEGQARDFEYSGWQVAAMSLGLAIDIADADTSELTEKTDDLESATGELSDGAASLSSGVGDLASGAASVASGAASLQSGNATLAQGAQSLAQGASALSSQSNALVGGWQNVRAGASSLVDGTASLAAGSKQYEAALDQVLAAAQASGDAQAIAMVSQLKDGYSQVGSGISAVSSGASQLSGGADAFSQALSRYTGAVGSLAQASGELSSGAQAALSGATELSSGAASLANGAATASSGARSLSSGAAELANAACGMGSEVIDGLQRAIDEKLGSDFTPHSFVVPENTQVKRVQFAWVIDGVDAPDNKAGAAAAGDDDGDEPQTILDRFLALFR